jgi:hypothetical protein
LEQSVFDPQSSFAAGPHPIAQIAPAGTIENPPQHFSPASQSSGPSQ